MTSEIRGIRMWIIQQLLLIRYLYLHSQKDILRECILNKSNLPEVSSEIKINTKSFFKKHFLEN